MVLGVQNPQGTQAHVCMVSELTGIILILPVTLASPRTTYIISGLALYSRSFASLSDLSSLFCYPGGAIFPVCKIRKQYPFMTSSLSLFFFFKVSFPFIIILQSAAL